MNRYRRNTIKQFCVLLCLIYIPSPSTLAADIEGIAGYTLGTVLDKQQVLKETKMDDGATIYRVKPVGSPPQIELLTVRITQSHQIHRISADSPVLSAADCQTRMTQLRKQIEQQFPTLGYYAMDQSEMFYEADRSYTLECVNTDAGIRLRQEYSDEKLAAE